MPPVLGHIIVIAILAIIVYFCGRNVIRGIKHELSGGGCTGCPGGCAGCSKCAKKLSQD